MDAVLNGWDVLDCIDILIEKKSLNDLTASQLSLIKWKLNKHISGEMWTHSAGMFTCPLCALNKEKCEACILATVDKPCIYEGSAYRKTVAKKARNTTHIIKALTKAVNLAHWRTVESFLVF